MSRRNRASIMVIAAMALGLAAPARAVVGGTIVPDPPPWLAAIRLPVAEPIRPSGQFCAGQLVSAATVVTAAHCVHHFRAAPELLRLTFGRADLTADVGETVTATAIRVHPGYADSAFISLEGESNPVHYNDIAMVTIDPPLPERATLALPEREWTDLYGPGASVLVQGWGQTSIGDPSNDRLRRTTVAVTDDSACAAAYGSFFDPAQMVCAAAPGQDTCNFDSGGPAIIHGVLAGLASWGSGCARPGFPGVYTRLAAYVPFVRS
ncbi:S1 family peptidase [Nocardia sp. NPDC127526]|uniref:S1 family peptidase n=1 Tax=Nocardia sp. NPDC127526 TaxID=3345393 RepID=UPI00362D9DBB